MKHPRTFLPALMHGRADVRAAAAGETEILVYGDIGDSWYGDGVKAQRIAKELKDAPKGDTIVVRINSFGGDAFEGVAIHNLLVSDGRKVVVKIDGAAISAASVIAMAGTERRIAESAMLMIHDPWMFAMGNAADLRGSADSLDKIADALCRTYARRTGKDDAACRDMMRAETWMSAAEALEHGFATHIDAPASEDDKAEDAEAALAAVVTDFSRERIAAYRNAPQRIAALARPPQEQAKPGPASRWTFSASGHEAVIAAFQGVTAAANEAAASAGKLSEALSKTNSPAPSAPVTDKDHDMDVKELQAALATAQAETATAKASLAKAHEEAKHATDLYESAEAKRAALETQNKALAEQRDQAVARADAAEGKLLDGEVDALIGKKIQPHERETFAKLARKDRDLFNELVAQRAPMATLNPDPAGIADEPIPEVVQAASGGSGEEFDRLVVAAAQH